MEIINTIGKYIRVKNSVNNPSELREGVRKAYSSAATDPEGKHPFPVGRGFAESIGYPEKLLDELPDIVSKSFAGVSNVSVFAEIPKGSTVLDLGCGTGLDSLIASLKTGRTGRVVGVDFSLSMVQRAREAGFQSERGNMDFYCAAAEKLPIPDETADVILVNGLFNLNPFRDQIFKELARVVKPGGVVYGAELILTKPQSNKKNCSLTEWFS